MFTKAQFRVITVAIHIETKKKWVYESWKVIRYHFNIFNSFIDSSLKN